jgi:hypothetical protein
MKDSVSDHGVYPRLDDKEEWFSGDGKKKQPGSPHQSFRMSREEKERLERYAQQTGRTVTAVIREALDMYFTYRDVK